MELQPQPFVSTHVANIARNTQLGLVFLQSGPQRTSGLTEVSEESFLNDQLQIARWMILHFLNTHPDDVTPDPWIKIPKWQVKINEFPAPDELESYKALMKQLHSQLESLDNPIWDARYEQAKTFLLRLTAQLNECIAFTNDRIAVIKMAHDLGTVVLEKEDYPEKLADCQDIIMRLGLKLGQQVIEACSMGLGMRGVATMGYLGVKNSTPAVRLFSYDLLDFARELITETAIERGYTPIATEQQD